MQPMVTTAGRGRYGVRFAAALLAALVGLATLLPTLAAAATECGCQKKGAYVSPACEEPEKSELSPGGGKYRLQTVDQTAYDVTLHVTDAASGNKVKDLTLPLPRLDWGFSPDGRTLMYRHAFMDSEGASPSIDVVGFWSLAGNKSLFYENVTSGAAAFFSPHGKYFALNILRGPGWSEIVVKESTLGAQVHYDELHFTSVQGSPGDKFGTAGTGFSPDDDDRTFVRSYRDTNGQVQLLAKNLETGANVVSTVVSPDSWWKFSPCGDVFGLVTQPDQVNIVVSLRKTEDGSAVGDTRWLPTSDSVRLESTLEFHQIIDVTPSGTNTINVGPNDADQSCTAAVALSSLTIVPTTVVGGEANPTGTVKLSGNATAPFTVSLTSDDSAAITVPASVTVAAGSSTATFAITSKPVTAARSVKVTATAGTVSKTATVTVNPPLNAPLESVTADPIRVPGGQPTTGTVTLTTAAGPSGSVVSLTSSNPSVITVPAKVTVPAGQLSATFPITTTAVRVDNASTITAVGGGYTRSTTVYALTTDRECNLGTTEASSADLHARAFAAFDDHAANADCDQNMTYRDALTIGAGTTGLPTGAPVTLQVSAHLDGTLMTSPPLGSGGANAEATASYRINDLSVPVPEGEYTAASFSGIYELHHSPQYGTAANVSRRTAVSLYTNAEADQENFVTGSETNLNAVIWDVDTGTMTARFTTTVGARLKLDARLSTVASAYVSGSNAISDFDHTFNAGIAPAAGFEGLALTYGQNQPPANQAPSCAAGSATTPEDTALVGTVACTDPEHAPLAHTVVAGPTHGVLSSVGADGSFTYTPNDNYAGADSFTIKANDGKADSPVITFALTVNAVEDAPLCNTGSATTDAGKALSGTISCTDADGDPLTFTVANAPAKGKLSVVAASGAFTYTPNVGYTGTDTFRVAASDGKTSAAATFTVTVRPIVGGAPTKLDQCLNNGWKSFTNPKFTNQTSCLVYVVIRSIFG